MKKLTLSDEAMAKLEALAKETDEKLKSVPKEKRERGERAFRTVVAEGARFRSKTLKTLQAGVPTDTRAAELVLEGRAAALISIVDDMMETVGEMDGGPSKLTRAKAMALILRNGGNGAGFPAILDEIRGEMAKSEEEEAGGLRPTQKKGEA